MTAYILKLIAVITMTFDHLGYIFYPGQLSWMNYIGRIAFPIFAFQISEGYLHTHNLKKYFKRLILFALISQIPYTWFSSIFFSKIGLNIIFTLILGLLSITIYDLLVKHAESLKQSNKNIVFSYKLLGIMIVLLISLFADKFGFDYGFYGVFLIFTFYILRDNRILKNIGVIIVTLLYYLPFFIASRFNVLYITLFFFSLVPIIFINTYNGKMGKKSKLLFYIFYPVHLLVLCLIFQLIQIFI